MKIGRFGRTAGDEENSENEYNDPPRPFIEHLLDLRTCVVRSLIVWATALVVVAPFAPMITRWLLSPASDSAQKVQGLDWLTGVNILIKIMLWGGTALSLPFLTFFILRFIFPGLKKSERSLIVCCLGGSTCLFLGGVWMAYAKILEVAFDVFQMINSWIGVKVDIIKIEEHIALVLKTIIAFGLAFQIPMLILLLGWMGILTSDGLRKKRRIAIVLTFAMAMLLTPPDPVSQVMMALPMCVLYEVCIWVIRLREIMKRKKRDEEYE